MKVHRAPGLVQSESLTQVSWRVWQKYPTDPAGRLMQLLSSVVSEGEQYSSPQSPSTWQSPWKHVFASKLLGLRHAHTCAPPQSESTAHAS
jgi:hypothetical protein